MSPHHFPFCMLLSLKFLSTCISYICIGMRSVRKENVHTFVFLLFPSLNLSPPSESPISIHITGEHTHTYIHVHIYIDTYTHIFKLRFHIVVRMCYFDILSWIISLSLMTSAPIWFSVNDIISCFMAEWNCFPYHFSATLSLWSCPWTESLAPYLGYHE